MRWAWLLFVLGCHRAPDLSWVEVTAGLPGASAETIAQRVTTPLERMLAQIDKLEVMRSESKRGEVVIHLGFARDVDEVFPRVQKAFEMVRNQLPREALPPTYLRRGAPLAWLAVDRGTGGAVADKLAQLEGVWLGAVCDGGEVTYRYRIDSARAAAAGTTPLEVLDALRGSAIDPMKLPLVAATTTREPGTPRCHAQMGDREVALIEVRGNAPRDAIGKLGTLLPEVRAQFGQRGLATVAWADGPTFALVERAEGSTLTLAGPSSDRVIQAARAIAARLGAPTRGLESDTASSFAIDFAAAARQSVLGDDVDRTIALVYGGGLVGPSWFTQRSVIASLVTATDGAIAVRALDRQLVPLEALAHRSIRPVLREVLHDGQLFAVRIYAKDEVDIGALPAGVTATWSRTIEP